jgi:hypothetical protein
MKPSKVSLLLVAAFAAGILADRQFFRRETDKTMPEGSFATRHLSYPSILDGAPMAKMGAAAQGDQSPDGHDKRRWFNGGLAQLLGMENEDAMRHATHRATAADLKKLLADTGSLDPSDPQVRQLKRALYGEWAHKEPQLALAAVLKEEDRRLQESVIHAAFGNMAREDLGTAKVAFQKLQTRRQRAEAIGAITHNAALADLASVAEFVPATHHEHVYERWAERDPMTAITHAEASGQRTQVLRSIARSWAHQSPQEALQWAQGQRPQVLTGALEAVAEMNPAQAAEWLAQMPPTHETRDLTRQVAHRWAQEDLSAALDWTSSLSGRMQTEAIESLSHQWAKQSPQEAAAFAQTLEAGEAREHTLSEVAHVWARQDIDQALTWAQSLGGEETMAAMHGITNTLADENPQAAADMVQQLVDQGEGYHDLAGDVAGRWSELEPTAAAAWAETLPENSELQRRAVESVADHWIENDPQAASEWIGELPGGETRDIAAERLVDHVAETDPDAAFAWAMTLSNPEHQQDLLHHVLQQWQDVDPQAAQSTLNNASLPAEQIQDLSEIFQEPR